MFKGQPRMIAAALANMGERFGFYTMMAILSLFLSAKFALMKQRRNLLRHLLCSFTYWPW
jgi:POT family proton-dependent oligopeptide transporter